MCQTSIFQHYLDFQNVSNENGDPLHPDREWLPKALLWNPYNRNYSPLVFQFKMSHQRPPGRARRLCQCPKLDYKTPHTATVTGTLPPPCAANSQNPPAASTVLNSTDPCDVRKDKSNLLPSCARWKTGEHSSKCRSCSFLRDLTEQEIARNLSPKSNNEPGVRHPQSLRAHKQKWTLLYHTKTRLRRH